MWPYLKIHVHPDLSMFSTEKYEPMSMAFNGMHSLIQQLRDDQCPCVMWDVREQLWSHVIPDTTNNQHRTKPTTARHESNMAQN